MPIRKLLEALGGKIVPARGNRFPVAGRQQPVAAAAPPPRRHYISGVGAEQSGAAIRRYLRSRREFAAPRDLAVFFDERRAVLVVAGTIPDEDTRALILQAAAGIHGVGRVEDRLTLSVMARPV